MLGTVKSNEENGTDVSVDPGPPRKLPPADESSPGTQPGETPGWVREAFAEVQNRALPVDASRAAKLAAAELDKANLDEMLKAQVHTYVTSYLNSYLELTQNESFVRLGALDKRVGALERSTTTSSLVPQLKRLDESAAQTESVVRDLRKQIDDERQQYSSELAALSQRIDAMELERKERDSTIKLQAEMIHGVDEVCQRKIKKLESAQNESSLEIEKLDRRINDKLLRKLDVVDAMLHTTRVDVDCLREEACAKQVEINETVARQDEVVKQAEVGVSQKLKDAADTIERLVKEADSKEQVWRQSQAAYDALAKHVTNLSCHLEALIEEQASPLRERMVNVEASASSAAEASTKATAELNQLKVARFEIDKEVYAKLDAARAAGESRNSEIFSRLESAEALVSTVKEQYASELKDMLDCRTKLAACESGYHTVLQDLQHMKSTEREQQQLQRNLEAKIDRVENCAAADHERILQRLGSAATTTAPIADRMAAAEALGAELSSGITDLKLEFRDRHQDALQAITDIRRKAEQQAQEAVQAAAVAASRSDSKTVTALSKRLDELTIAVDAALPRQNISNLDTLRGQLEALVLDGIKDMQRRVVDAELKSDRSETDAKRALQCIDQLAVQVESASKASSQFESVKLLGVTLETKMKTVNETMLHLKGLVEGLENDQQRRFIQYNDFFEMEREAALQPIRDLQDALRVDVADIKKAMPNVAKATSQQIEELRERVTEATQSRREELRDMAEMRQTVEQIVRNDADRSQALEARLAEAAAQQQKEEEMVQQIGQSVRQLQQDCVSADWVMAELDKFEKLLERPLDERIMWVVQPALQRVFDDSKKHHADALATLNETKESFKATAAQVQESLRLNESLAADVEQFQSELQHIATASARADEMLRDTMDRASVFTQELAGRLDKMQTGVLERMQVMDQSLARQDGDTRILCEQMEQYSKQHDSQLSRLPRLTDDDFAVALKRVGQLETTVGAKPIVEGVRQTDLVSDLREVWAAIGDTNKRSSEEVAELEVMSGRVSALDKKVNDITSQLGECLSESGGAFGTVTQMQEQLALVHRLVNDMRAEIDHKVGSTMGRVEYRPARPAPQPVEKYSDDPAVQSIVSSAMARLETTIQEPSSNPGSPTPHHRSTLPTSYFSRSGSRSSKKSATKKVGVLF